MLADAGLGVVNINDRAIHEEVVGHGQLLAIGAEGQ